MRPESGENSGGPKRQPTSAMPIIILWVLILAAISSVTYGGTRLFMEYLPVWLSMALAFSAAILLCVTVVAMTGRDFMDVVVALAVIIILTLMLVPALLNRKHRNDPGLNHPVPVAAPEMK